MNFKIKIRHKFIEYHKCDKNITFVEVVKYIVHIVVWTGVFKAIDVVLLFMKITIISYVIYKI